MAPPLATDDVLVGGLCSDLLAGWGGNDVLTGLSGNDVLDGGDGVDTASYAGSVEGVTIDLLNGTAIGGDAAGDTFISIENVTGSAWNTLYGDALANVLNGGDDTLSGKDGADTLTGGDGLDSFVFDTALGAGNIDAITTFIAADDTIVLDDAIFTALAVGPLAAEAFVTGSDALDAEDRIIWNDVTNALFYDEDGVGGVAAIQFASIGSFTGALSAADFSII